MTINCILKTAEEALLSAIDLQEYPVFDDEIFEKEDIPDLDAEIYHQAAEEAMPHFNKNLLELAKNNLWIALTEHDVYGSTCAIDVIKYVIYEHILDHLYDFWRSGEWRYSYA